MLNINVSRILNCLFNKDVFCLNKLCCMRKVVENDKKSLNFGVINLDDL